MQGYQQEDDVRERELRLAQDLSVKQDWESAYDLAYKWLKINPNDPEALNLICYIMLNTEKVCIAYPILRHLTSIEPENPMAWLNMGMAANDLWRYNESLRAYKKGLKYAKGEEERSMLCVNIASLMVDHGRFKEAEPYCKQAIELRPDTVKGRANLGFCQLANREWEEGWKNYRYCLDTDWRRLNNYNDEPLWTGKEKGTICIYGEQGLGDEISFGQMLIDMKEWCDNNDSTLVVDVNPRLESLFKRFLPDVEVHGTRADKQISWDPRHIDYSLPMAQIGEYFRTSDDSFPGTPYLKPDPDRVLQWKALFKSKKKPVIGLGWRGGIWQTAAKYRQLDLRQLLPVLKSVDAHFVSLQYKPASKEIEAFKAQHPEIDICEYPHGTLSNDYEDTVAMIAALDHVVTMQTTVVHVAGGLGVPCWTFVPSTSQWRYGQGGEDFPWAKSVRIIRQENGSWDGVMERTGEELANLRGLQKAATGTARKQKNKLRNNRGKVRRNGRGNDRHAGDRASA